MSVKVTPSFAVEAMSGKPCRSTAQIFATNKQTGRITAYEKHSYPNPNTEAQQKVRASFKERTKAASDWWNANKPSESNPQGTELYLDLMQKYKQQHRIGNPFSYLCSLVKSDLTIPINPPSDTESGSGSTGGSTSKPSTGGNDNEL